MEKNMATARRNFEEPFILYKQLFKRNLLLYKGVPSLLQKIMVNEIGALNEYHFSE